MQVNTEINDSTNHFKSPLPLVGLYSPGVLPSPIVANFLADTVLSVERGHGPKTEKRIWRFLRVNWPTPDSRSSFKRQNSHDAYPSRCGLLVQEIHTVDELAVNNTGKHSVLFVGFTSAQVTLIPPATSCIPHLVPTTFNVPTPVKYY
jgi:hypothetical protein